MILYKEDLSENKIDVINYLTSLPYDNLLEVAPKYINVLGQSIFYAITLSEPIKIKTKEVKAIAKLVAIKHVMTPKGETKKPIVIPPVLKEEPILPVIVVKTVVLSKSEIKQQLLQSKVKKRMKYQREARKLTNLQPTFLLRNSDKPKLWHKSQFQSYDFYVIDHKISVAFGFKNNISIEDIAHLSNLRCISAKENSIKAQKNFIDNDNKWILDKYHIKIK